MANSNAVGAIVQFSPGKATVDPIGSGALVTFEVTVIPEVEGGFDTADLLFGSEDGLSMVDFEYSDDWHAAFATVTRPTVDWFGNIWIGGANPTLNDVSSLYAGILTVDAVGLPIGEYRLGVDAGADGFSSLGQKGVPDPAHGSALVTIPEPTTLTLLALASLSILRRRARRS